MHPVTRLLLAAFLAMLPLAARAQTEQQTLVDRATLAVQEMLGEDASSDARNLVRKARGALICPRVFKAGFFFGGQGGGCVLVGRLQTGWTAPAFYGMGSGSFGLQIGIEDAEILFIVLTEKGLHALLDSQFKIGADAGVAVATIGAGVQGSTTAAFRADIVAFSRARGLFAGISLDGSLIGSRSDWNQSYYGRPIAAQQIVLQGEGSNPGAEPLREVLGRFSGG
jgi:lipid-binding SYLF domain-containing protein